MFGLVSEQTKLACEVVGHIACFRADLRCLQETGVLRETALTIKGVLVWGIALGAKSAECGLWSLVEKDEAQRAGSKAGGAKGAKQRKLKALSARAFAQNYAKTHPHASLAKIASELALAGFLSPKTGQPYDEKTIKRWVREVLKEACNSLTRSRTTT
jgi:hypothetical protein